MQLSGSLAEFESAGFAGLEDVLIRLFTHQSVTVKAVTADIAPQIAQDVEGSNPSAIKQVIGDAIVAAGNSEAAGQLTNASTITAEVAPEVLSTILNTPIAAVTTPTITTPQEETPQVETPIQEEEKDETNVETAMENMLKD